MLSDDVFEDFKLLASDGGRREAASSPQSGRRLEAGSTFEGARLGMCEWTGPGHGGAEWLEK